MTWLEQNIDAYRIVSEILGDLRRAVRHGLEAAFGESWYRDGLPEDVFKRLVAAKEREKSIDWYEGQYQQIMDYAIFADLVEILENNIELFPELTSLAPNTALLQARFIELDVMRAKLGRARPISETELSFLGTFHQRFRKAIAQMPVHEPSVNDDPPPKKEAPQQPTPRRRADDKPPKQEPVKPPPKIPEDPPADPGPPTPPQKVKKPKAVIERVVQPAPPKEEKVEFDDGDDHGEDVVAEAPPQRPPTRRVQSSTVSAPPEDEPPGDVEEFDTNTEPADDEYEEPGGTSGDRPAVGPKKLADALENNNHRAVLRELYREVTTIAEGVWTSDVTPAPLVWEQVTASTWYENNFSRLGLQALSVFYEVTGKVEEMAREGATKKELQEFLKETNFAKTLLALRDMFQANNL